ncbi:MAG TPA: response regulator [Polyangia bacterium]|nr:response regulator [Polyangia bacterium]
MDDDAELRDLYARYLDDAGYCVSVARDGAEAVDVATMVQPHAIVMDVSMPLMNGCEAAGLIRNGSQTSSIPIVALTAENLEELEGGSFDTMLEKPLTPPALEEVLADITH